MFRYLLGTFFLLLVLACSSTDEHSITEFKPDLPKDRKEARDGFVGKWESFQPTKAGGTRHTIIERYYDSRYLVEFKVFDSDKNQTHHQKEFGYWGVAGGIYFTMFRGWVENDSMKEANPDNPYYYDSYQILEIQKDKLVFESLSSGNVFTYNRMK